MRTILKNMPVERLVEQWELICKMECNEEVYMVRGWILKELEERVPEKMGKYYDGFYEDEELRKFVLG